MFAQHVPKRSFKTAVSALSVLLLHQADGQVEGVKYLDASRSEDVRMHISALLTQCVPDV